jgi:hypothetical protein
MTLSIRSMNLRLPIGWLAVGALVGCLNLRLSAATNLVVVGDDLQTKINAAAPGDTLVVQSGIYGGVGSLTINKPLSLVRSGVDRAVINLPVAVSAPGVVTFSKIDFGMDLAFGGTNCTVRIYEAVGKNIASTNGALVIRRSTFDRMDLTGTRLEALRLTNTSTVRLLGNGTGMPKVPAVMVQSRCDHHLVLEQGMLATLGYCFLAAVIGFDSEINAVGTKVFNWSSSHRIGPCRAHYTSGTTWGHNAVALNRTRSRWWNCQIFLSGIGGVLDCSSAAFAIHSQGGADLEVCNSDLIVYGPGIVGRWGGHSYGIFMGSGRALIRDSFFHLESHSAVIGNFNANNNMIMLVDNPSVQLINSRGVSFDWDHKSDTTPWQGDSVKDGHPSIASWAPQFPVVAGSNIGSVWGFTPSPTNPIDCSWLLNAKNTIIIPTTGPNAYKDFTNELAADSPLMNAGSDDPVLRNRDGTRNTIGATGGPMYNPALATTDQPMAFWLGLFPQRIVKGSVNTVDLDAAAAAGH